MLVRNGRHGMVAVCLERSCVCYVFFALVPWPVTAAGIIHHREEVVMCGHIFVGYQGHQPLRQHRLLWRCSTCGRQSHMPLDCCCNPAFHMSQPNPMIVIGARWLRRLMDRMQTSIRSRLLRLSSRDMAPVSTKIDLPDDDGKQPQHALADADRQPFPVLVADVEFVSAYGDLSLDGEPMRLVLLQDAGAIGALCWDR